MAHIYSYSGLNAQGKELSGQLQADDLSAARLLLRGQGIRILSLQQGVGESFSLRHTLTASGRWLKSGLSVRNSDLMLFYRQMHLMLRSGHTLLEALAAAGLLAARPRLSQQLERIAERIRGGSSFSAALAQERRAFPRIVVKLSEAGEASGELDQVFERLAVMTERRADIRRQLLTALTYPGIVLLAAIGVISFLVGSVVPRFAVFLQARGKAIPWAAQTLMDVADALQRWGGLLAMALLALVGGLVLLRQLPAAARRIDSLLLRLPIIGATLMSAAMAQSIWIFGLLLKSRLTVLEALRTLTEISGNAHLSQAFARAEQQVLNGHALTVALNVAPIPTLVRHMAAIGERSGEMDSVLATLGEHYQRDLDGRVKLLSSMIEPILTMLIGGIVGFVYYAFFQAVLAVSTG